MKSGFIENLFSLLQKWLIGISHDADPNLYLKIYHDSSKFVKSAMNSNYVVLIQLSQLQENKYRDSAMS